jgi:hypothetical protein
MESDHFTCPARVVHAGPCHRLPTAPRCARRVKSAERIQGVRRFESVEGHS